MSDNEPSNEYLIGCLQRRVETMERDLKEVKGRHGCGLCYYLLFLAAFNLIFCRVEIKASVAKSIQSMIDKSIADHEKETK